MIYHTSGNKVSVHFLDDPFHFYSYFIEIVFWNVSQRSVIALLYLQLYIYIAIKDEIVIKSSGLGLFAPIQRS